MILVIGIRKRIKKGQGFLQQHMFYRKYITHRHLILVGNGGHARRTACRFLNATNFNYRGYPFRFGFTHLISARKLQQDWNLCSTKHIKLIRVQRYACVSIHKMFVCPSLCSCSNIDWPFESDPVLLKVVAWRGKYWTSNPKSQSHLNSSPSIHGRLCPITLNGWIEMNRLLISNPRAKAGRVHGHWWPFNWYVHPPVNS